MLPLANVSRRAFVFAAALAATPATAVAARRRKPAPQAFLAIAIQGVTISANAFAWRYQAQLHHPASGFTQDMSETVTDVSVTASQEETRQRIIAKARTAARDFLSEAFHDVAADRIAVVLL